MKKYFFSLIILIQPVAFALNINQWPFYKEIKLPPQFKGVVFIELDKEILTNMKVDGSDIRILEDNKEIPFKLILKQPPEYSKNIREIKTSSIKPKTQYQEFLPEYMIDGDFSKNRYFQINSKTDKNFSVLTFDLGESILTTRIKIWNLSLFATWKYIKIEGSNNAISWNVIKEKTFYEPKDTRQILYPPSIYRFLRLTLWHTGDLIVNEIQIFGEIEGKVVFSGTASKNYKIYYGNPLAETPKYDVSHLYFSKKTPKVELTRQIINPGFGIDLDKDGIINIKDNCPTVYNPDQKDKDRDGIGGACDNCVGMKNPDQKDIDDDGVGDVCDNCPSISNPDQFDDDFNGIGWICDDKDNDGIINSEDNCLHISNPDQKDLDRNGIGDICEDDDKDGIPAKIDNCLQVKNPDQKDTDRDRIGDACDNCVFSYNPDQFDKDDDGIGDVCEDDDKDKIINFDDNCSSVYNPDQKDTDGDGVGDVCDNCPKIKNETQVDSDNDGIGDICEDDDKDGILNIKDNCPSIANPKQKDRNNDGVGDACEDWDNDGVLNYEDNCLWVYNPKIYKRGEYFQPDVDGDGIGDACDKKDDRIFEDKKLVWGIIAFSIIILSILAYRLSKKKI